MRALLYGVTFCYSLYLPLCCFRRGVFHHGDLAHIVFQALHDLAKACGDRVGINRVAALIMLYCGLRRGEIIPLEWSDIDFINKQIAITKSVELKDSNNYTVKSHTKNGKDRYVSIPDNIIPF